MIYMISNFLLFLYNVLPIWKLWKRDYVISPFQMFSDFLKSQGIFPLRKTHGWQDLSSYLLKISFLMTTLRAPIIIFEKWKHGYPTLKIVVRTKFLSKSAVSGLIKGRKNNNSEIWMNFYLLQQKQESYLVLVAATSFRGFLPSLILKLEKNESPK